LHNPQGGSQTRPYTRPYLLALLVFVVAIAAMGRIWSNDFINWDDSTTLYANPRMNPPTWETLKFYWTHSEFGLYIPGTYTIWAGLAKLSYRTEIDLRGSHLSAGVFHAASVTCHALAAVVVFLVLRRLLKAKRESSGVKLAGSGSSDIAACIGACLFAVHPVQVESVGWASGLKDVLCGLFALMAVWQYLIAVQSEGTWRRVHFALATAAFAWGMLCKPTAMVTPAIVFVLDWIVLGRSWKQVAWATALWWPMSIAAMVIARLAQTTFGQSGPPLWQRPLVALDAIAFYLGKMIWPAQLTVDYGRRPQVALDQGWLWWTWLVPAAVAAVLYWKPRKELIAAGIVLVICVSPVLGLTPFQFQYFSTVSDHYLYIAMLGPGLALAWVVARFGNRAVMGGAVGALVLLGALSVRQAGVWRDAQSLFTHTLTVNPDSFMACNNLASAFTHAGDVSLGAAQLSARLGESDKSNAYRAQAEENYRKSLELFIQAAQVKRNVTKDDDYLTAYANVAAMYSRLDDDERALAYREKAIAIALTYPPNARRDLPAMYCLKGHDLLRLGRPREAATAFDEALKLQPRSRMALDGKTRALAALASLEVEKY
jgi:hypothetical protein